jgi:NarL family two-component system response regulator YdfI
MPDGAEKIRVLIADDHPVVRTGLRLMLGMGKDIELVGEAADGAAAVLLVGEMQPDVVLMDLRMPAMDGISAIERIHRGWPQVAVIILTTYDEDDLMIQGLRAGARGYLLKECGLDTLLRSVRVAARGEMLVQPEIMTRILSYTARPPLSTSPSPSSQEHGSVTLTAREQEVLAGVARGERSKEIALRLGITRRTVEAYLTNIYTKLNVDSRSAAVAIAIERGLLPLQD